MVLSLLLPIMNNASVNICEQIFAQKYAFSYLGYTSRSAFSSSCGNSMFNILRNCQTILHRYHFTLSAAMYEGFHFSSSLSTLVSFQFLFYYNCPNGCEVLSPCGFDLRLPNN